MRRYYILTLGYYVIDRDMKAVGYTRESLPDMTAEQLEDLMGKFFKRVETVYKDLNTVPSGEDISEYREYVQRIKDRLSLIK